MKNFIIILVILLTNVFSSSYAEEIKAGDVSIVTDDYTSSIRSKTLPQGIYRYRVSWQGIPAAEAVVTIKHVKNQSQASVYGHKFYDIEAFARTYSPINLIYDMQYLAKGPVSFKNFTSPVFESLQKENSRRKRTFVEVDAKNNFHSRRQFNSKPVEEYSFKPKNNMLTPLAASLLSRQLTWNVGTVRDFDVFNGKSRYLISLESIDEREIYVSGKKYKTWVISPQVWNLTNMAKNKKLKSAEVFINKYGDHELVRIVSKVFIGSVKVDLIEVKKINK
jgi:hypothetical protein